MSSPLEQALRLALELHGRELDLMRSGQHALLEACCAQKLEAALQAQRLASQAQALSEPEAELAGQLRQAAMLNAEVARKMLEQSMAKAEFLRSLAAPSYGSDGKASGLGGGGLLDLRA